MIVRNFQYLNNLIISRCAYTEIEIDIFKNRYRMDYSNVSEYNETLINVLKQLKKNGYIVDGNVNQIFPG